MTLVQTEPKKIYIYVEAQPITTAWIYHNEELWLISLSSDWTNWITIADKNLWATTAYSSWDTMSESNCWKFYQRWNNYWFPFTWPTTTSPTQVNAQNYWPSNYYSSSTYITDTFWDSSKNVNLWGDTTDTLVARRWPCAEWWHIPSRTEMLALGTLWNSMWLWNFANGSWQWWYWADKYLSYLKIPLCWWLTESWGTMNRDTAAYIWTSTALALSYWLNAARQLSYANRADQPSYDAVSRACSIRPFKNEAAQPDDSWTVIYQ